jgi:GT2 family glycosyltransferase
MPSALPETAILIVAYNGKAYLGDCLQTVLDSQDGSCRQRIVVVDNGSTDGTVEYLAAEFPQVECVAAGQNLGFAGGNNLGWKHIEQRYPGTTYLCLLNQDTVVERGWLQSLVVYLERHPDVGCVQPKLRLFPETQRLNTTGNRSHFLGFGFMTHYGEADHGQYDRPASIDCASGAALLVRADLLRRVGLFEPVLFMYLEDVELSWKLRQIGADVVYVPQSVVYHKYLFKNDYRYYFCLERNRWWLLLVYYKAATLWLLLPALLLMELGQLGFALRHGRVWDKLRCYGFFLQRQNLGRLWTQRRLAQRRRTIDDRQFLARFSGQIDFPELNRGLVRWVANPIFNGYWNLAKRLLFW